MLTDTVKAEEKYYWNMYTKDMKKSGGNIVSEL